MNAIAKIDFDLWNLADFFKGELDCIHDIGAKKDQSAEYYRGYGERYELEAIAGVEVNHG